MTKLIEISRKSSSSRSNIDKLLINHLSIVSVQSKKNDGSHIFSRGARNINGSKVNHVVCVPDLFAPNNTHSAPRCLLPLQLSIMPMASVFTWPVAALINLFILLVPAVSLPFQQFKQNGELHSFRYQ